MRAKAPNVLDTTSLRPIAPMRRKSVMDVWWTRKKSSIWQKNLRHQQHTSQDWLQEDWAGLMTCDL